jgi:hypothetical protein
MYCRWVLAAAALSAATGLGCSSAKDENPNSLAPLVNLPVEHVGDPIDDARVASYLTTIEADRRLTEFLTRHPVASVIVRHSNDPDFDLILLVLAQKADDAAWPLQFIDVCAIGHPPGITGVIWQAMNGSLTANVSPRWSDVDCMGSTAF